jgi:hypothetical protein
MSMDVKILVETGPAALLFAVTFLYGGRISLLGWLVRDERSTISFGAGMSAAYVFVHLVPELHGVRLAFAEGASMHLPFEGMFTYFVALIGFLGFYALDHFRERLENDSPGEESKRAFRLHIAGFAAYACLMAYLLVHSLEESAVSTAAYAAAIAFHFLSIAHSLRGEHGSLFQNLGRFILAGAVLIGWLVGLILPIERAEVAILMAFVSGAIIMNSLIMELPTEKDGRFVPFMAGGIIYGLILLPLG